MVDISLYVKDMHQGHSNAFSKNHLISQLRKAVMDHVSDSFLETNVPLLVLIEAAKNGNEKEVKEYAQVFREHANKLIEVLYVFLFVCVFCFVFFLFSLPLPLSLQCICSQNLTHPQIITLKCFNSIPLVLHI